jgi:hypothetical protein
MKVILKETTPTNPFKESSIELSERIRHRAYELYEQRGMEPGHDVRIGFEQNKN